MQERKETKWVKKTKWKQIRKWQPNVWLPEYEMIVADSCKGKSNTELAETYKFTPQHISNILNTEEARNIKAAIVKAIRQQSLDLMEKQYSDIVTKSVDNIHKVIHDDSLMETAPGKFMIFDKSIVALKGLGKLQEEAKAGVINNNQVNNIMVINNTQETAITKGLDDLKLIAELHKDVTGESIK